MVTYPAMLDVSRELVTFLAESSVSPIKRSRTSMSMIACSDFPFLVKAAPAAPRGPVSDAAASARTGRAASGRSPRGARLQGRPLNIARETWAAGHHRVQRRRPMGEQQLPTRSMPPQARCIQVVATLDIESDYH